MLQTEKEFQRLKGDFEKFKRDVNDTLGNIGRENMDEEMQYYIFQKIDSVISGYQTALDGAVTDINQLKTTVQNLQSRIESLENRT